MSTKTKPRVKRWIEVSATYLTDFKRRPMEAVLFVNLCRYNPAAKHPTLRRRTSVQTLTGDTKQQIEEALLDYVSRRGVRLLRDGLDSNDFKRLPPEVKNPPKSIIDGRASIYADV